MPELDALNTMFNGGTFAAVFYLVVRIVKLEAICEERFKEVFRRLNKLEVSK